MDKQIDEALKKAFQGRPTHFNTLRGKDNCFKVKLENGVAYAYIDAFRGEQLVELDLVTIVLQDGERPQVYINELIFNNNFRAERNELKDLEVSFQRNPNQNEIVLVQISYHYRNGKNKNKVGMLPFHYDNVKRKEKFIMEDIITKKPLLQAQWHPLFESILLVITNQGFQIIELTPDGFYWRGSTTFRTLGIQSISNFRFWPHKKGIRQLTVIAVGESGDIHFLLCLLNEENMQELPPKLQQRISFCPPYSLQQYRTIKSTLGMACKGMQISCLPSTQFLLLIRKTISTTGQGAQHFLAISILEEDVQEFNQYNLMTVKGVLGSPEFEIPQNCIYLKQFHFWCGDKLTRLDLSNQMDYLSQKNQRSSIKASQKIQADVLLKIQPSNFKFLFLESTSIIVLRRAQTCHTYLFDTIPVKTIELSLQEKNVRQKLKLIFNDLQSRLDELKKEDAKQTIEIKSKVKQLTESGGEKQLDLVTKTMEKVMEEGEQLIQKEKKELDSLYQRARCRINDFERSKYKWNQLDSLLSRIEKNSSTISELEKKSQSECDKEGKINSLQAMSKYIKERPLNIEQSHRDKYLKEMDNQLILAKQISTRIKDIQSWLQLPIENS